MFEDMSNSEKEKAKDDVNGLSTDMSRLVIAQASSTTSDIGLGSPVLSSADSYNITVEAYTIDGEEGAVLSAVSDVDTQEIANDMLVDRGDDLTEDEEEDVEDTAWLAYDNSFLIHRGLFDKGILAIRPYNLKNRRLLTVNNNCFAISSSNSHVDRSFRFYTRGEFLNSRTQVTLILVKVLPIKGSLEQHKVYIQQQGEKLVYAVMLDKKRVVGILGDIIINTEVSKDINTAVSKDINTAVSKDINTEVSKDINTAVSQEFLDNHKYAILNNIYKNGHIKNAHLMKTESLLNGLKPFLDYKPNAIDINNIIVNTNRSEEIFFPVILNDGSRELGFYAYPWVFESIKDFKFSGFNRVVTAGCMFGTLIKAVDHHDWSCNFIKHNLPFSPNQQICDILIESLISCYEQTLFSEFDKLLLLVDKLSKTEDKKQIYYHLPFYDYILFGVELFNKNRIELPALNKFFEEVLNKKEEHVNNISEMCKRHGISCIIESPFENLFDYNALVAIKNSRRQQKECLLAKHVLSFLDMTEDSRYPVDILIKIILNKLTSNSFNLNHKEVWLDFYAVILQELGPSEEKNIDDLFKIANAIMIAIASKDQQDYTVCALHTLSEKPISVSFGKLRRNFVKKAKENEDPSNHPLRTYGASFNMTVMEPVLGYSTSCNGLLFYFPNNKSEEFSDLINNRQILSHMHRNIVDVTLNREGTSLSGVLLPRV